MNGIIAEINVLTAVTRLVLAFLEADAPIKREAV